MSLIKNIKFYPNKKMGSKKALVLCGFGGSVWQTKRLIKVLHNADYDVTALDFSKTVLSEGNLLLLPKLVQEVISFSKVEAKKSNKPILLVGISLGALLSLNLLRRSDLFDKGVLITGGDIVKVAQNKYGKKVWPQSYAELAEIWKHVNIYTNPQELVGKRLLFVLPSRDKLIDPDDVRNEVQLQKNAGNKIVLIERHLFGHIGTIIEETILFPKRTIDYIRQVNESL